MPTIPQHLSKQIYAGIISVVENYSPAFPVYVGLPLLDQIKSQSLPYSFQFSVTRPFTYNLSRPDLVEIDPLANRDDFYVKMKSTTYVPIYSKCFANIKH